MGGFKVGHAPAQFQEAEDLRHRRGLVLAIRRGAIWRGPHVDGPCDLHQVLDGCFVHIYATNLVSSWSLSGTARLDVDELNPPPLPWFLAHDMWI